MLMTLEGVHVPPGSRQVIWHDNDNRLEIFMDADGKVSGKHRRAGYYRRTRARQILDWLRSW